MAAALGGEQNDGQPRIIIATTIKGRGISFMEGDRNVGADGGIYAWHSGAPDDDDYGRGLDELISRCGAAFKRVGNRD